MCTGVCTFNMGVHVQYGNVIVNVPLCVDSLRSLLANLTQGSFNTVLMNSGFDLAGVGYDSKPPHSHRHPPLHAWGEELSHCLLP